MYRSRRIWTVSYTHLDVYKRQVKGRKSVNGWTAIKRLLEEAGEGDTETLIMNGASIVPGNVLAVLKGRDVTLVLDMGDGMSWTLNGQSFTEEEFGDIDFSVEIKTGIIPDDIIRSLAGDRNTIQLSLAYDGAFGFTASLSLDLEEKNAGLYASLFAYDGPVSYTHLDVYKRQL